MMGLGTTTATSEVIELKMPIHVIFQVNAFWLTFRNY